MWLTLDKDDSSWEVMSSMASTSDRGYSRVMTRLLKKSNQLTMVVEVNVGRHLSVEWFVSYYGFSAVPICHPLMMQYVQCLLWSLTKPTSQSKSNVLLQYSRRQTCWVWCVQGFTDPQNDWGVPLMSGSVTSEQVIMNYLLSYSSDVDMNIPVFTDYFYMNTGRCSSCHGEAQGGEVARSSRRKAEQEPCNG